MEEILQTAGRIVSISNKREYKPNKHILTFTIQTNAKYPQQLEMTMFDKQIDAHCGKLIEGSSVGIKFNIKSREYNNNFYYSFVPWSIEVLEASSNEDSHDPDLDDEVPF